MFLSLVPSFYLKVKVKLGYHNIASGGRKWSGIRSDVSSLSLRVVEDGEGFRSNFEISSVVQNQPFVASNWALQEMYESHKFLKSSITNLKTSTQSNYYQLMNNRIEMSLQANLSSFDRFLVIYAGFFTGFVPSRTTEFPKP